jgi:hypothetical protein
MQNSAQWPAIPGNLSIARGPARLRQRMSESSVASLSFGQRLNKASSAHLPGGQAHPGSFTQRWSIIQHGADRRASESESTQAIALAQLVAIRNCLCCNLAAGMRRPPRRDHQNGTFPTSICLRRKETIAIVWLTRLLD